MKFEVRVSGFDESELRDLAPSIQAATAARAKANAVADSAPDAWVIGCDTVVAIDGIALGQPRDDGDARRMLDRLRGRVHSVTSAVCVVAPQGHRPPRAHGSAISRVRVAALSDAEMDAYVGTGEGKGKAGAYAIQGLAGHFCALERGAVDTVIGLPLGLLHKLLRELGSPFVW